MNHACVNHGGAASLICADTPLILEQECHLDQAGRDALAIWQARVGEVVTVMDCEQAWFRARICHLDAEGATILPFEFLGSPESPLEICVYQALPNKERFELVMQKLTEIGVTRIVPFVSQHSSTLEQRDAGQKKSHRWPEVILRAARQCRRAQLPELSAVQSWDSILSELGDWEVKLLLDEKGGSWSFKEGIGTIKPTRIALIVGPEGGFARDEVMQAQQQGAVLVTLGARILRTETAAIVAASLVQYIAGDYA